MGTKRALNKEDSEPFPRGGVHVLTPSEKRKAFEAASAELDLEATAKRHRRKQGKRQKHNEDDYFSAEDTMGKIANHADLLTAKTVTEGMKLLGMITEISPLGLVVSLPYNLRGHVDPSEASDLLHLLLNPKSAKGNAEKRAQEGMPVLPDLFRVGQYVRCHVLQGAKEEDEVPEGKQRHKLLQVSLRLKYINAGLSVQGLLKGTLVPSYVKSVEDHGYVIGFGLKGVKGFLPKKDVSSALGKSIDLLPGALLDCLVKDSNSPAAVALSWDPAQAPLVVTTSDMEGVSLESLLPGMMVTGKVQKVLDNGLLVSFLTYFHGTINQYHVAHSSTDPQWAKQYKANDKVKARILHVDLVRKKVGLSLLPHILSWSMPTPLPDLGQVVDNCVVRRIEKSLGAVLKVPCGQEACGGFVHVSNISDEHVKEVEAALKLGQVVKGRVIGYRLLDGLALVALKPSVVEHNVLGIRDVVPGMILAGKVERKQWVEGQGVTHHSCVGACVPRVGCGV